MVLLLRLNLTSTFDTYPNCRGFAKANKDYDKKTLHLIGLQLSLLNVDQLSHKYSPVCDYFS